MISKAQSSLVPTPVPSVSASFGISNKELERQIECLKLELEDRKKEREAHEKQEKAAKDVLQKEIESLRRQRDKAETEAKEANYLRMKINELKMKMSALEMKSQPGPEENMALNQEWQEKLDSKVKEIEHLQNELQKVQGNYAREAQKKRDEMKMREKEHEIEVRGAYNTSDVHKFN